MISFLRFIVHILLWGAFFFSWQNFAQISGFDFSTAEIEEEIEEVIELEEKDIEEIESLRSPPSLFLGLLRYCFRYLVAHRTVHNFSYPQLVSTFVSGCSFTSLQDVFLFGTDPSPPVLAA